MTNSTSVAVDNFSSILETWNDDCQWQIQSFKAMRHIDDSDNPFRLDINFYYKSKLKYLEELYSFLLNDGLFIQKTFTDDRVGPVSERQQMMEFNSLVWRITLNPSLTQFNEVMRDPRSQMNERNLAHMSRVLVIEQKMLHNALCIRYIYNVLAQMRANGSTQKDFITLKNDVRRLRFNYGPVNPIPLGRDRLGYWKIIAERTDYFPRFFKYPKAWILASASSGQVTERVNINRPDLH